MKNYKDNYNDPLVNIVIALPCEAKPFIQYYRLKKIHDISEFPIYRNKSNTLHLIISGVGKIHSAQAITYLHMITGQKHHAVYMNIGIAGGHSSAEKGKCFFANKIIDMATLHAFYPSTHILSNYASCSVKTYDQSQSECCDNGLVEMEASGFFQAGRKLVSQEQLFCVKIISDSGVNNYHDITPKQTTQLIENNLTSFSDMMQRLLNYSSDISNMYFYSDTHIFTERWHFTQYQRYQLYELLRRWHALRLSSPPIEICHDVNSAKSVLLRLSDTINQTDYIW